VNSLARTQQPQQEPSILSWGDVCSG
jgi:hypothetical protein